MNLDGTLSDTKPVSKFMTNDCVRIIADGRVGKVVRTGRWIHVTFKNSDEVWAASEQFPESALDLVPASVFYKTVSKGLPLPKNLPTPLNQSKGRSAWHPRAK